MEIGIQKQSRQYVHMSLDFDIAYSVGKHLILYQLMSKKLNNFKMR